MSPVAAPDKADLPKTRAEAYAILGVQPGAPYRQVRAAYRARAWQAHPDQGGSPAQWLPVAAAWEMLRGIIPAEAAAEATPPPAPGAGTEPGAFDPSTVTGTGAAGPTRPGPEEPATGPEREEDSPPVDSPPRARGQWRPGRLLTLTPDPWLFTFAVLLVAGTVTVGMLAGATATPALATYAAGWALILLWQAYGRPWGR